MSIKTGFQRIKFAGRKYSPELCLIGGAISGLAALYFTFKAGKKTDVIIAEHNYARDMLDINRPEDEKEYKKHKAALTLNTAKDLTITFAPALACAGLTTYLTLTGFGIQRKRIAGLTAAFNSVNVAYNGLVSAIEAKYGHEVAEDLMFNRASEKVPVTVENEDGTYSTELKKVKTYSPDNNVPFTFVFSKETSKYWKNDPQYNIIFLNNLQRSVNDQLKIRGFRHMNDILEQAGLELHPAGYELGWVFDYNDDEAQNYIDLGFTTMTGDTDHTKILRGGENAVLIHLKPDGYINHLFKEYSNI